MAKNKAKNKRNEKIIAGILAIVTAVSLAGLFVVSPSTQNTTNTTTTADSASFSTSTIAIPCVTGSTTIALRPHLTIHVDGEEVPVPSGIGTTNGCTQEIHTENEDGIIYVNSNTDKGYTFADFLAVWGLSLQQAGYITKLTVNGEFNQNDPNFKLENGQDIELDFITPIVPVDTTPTSTKNATATP